MAERLTDIELDSIQLTDARPRDLVRTQSHSNWQEEDVETGMGMIHIAVQGTRGKPAMFTYHDIGLNSNTCFEGFFSYEDMQPILERFCVYHINAPGQQEGALPLPQGLGFTGDQSMLSNYQYPSLDNLAEMLLPVMQMYGVKTFVGFGVGAGANILSRFALAHPDKVDGLCLLNGSSTKAGWNEWGNQKWNTWYLKSGQFPANVQEYLLWYWLGKKTGSENHDLVTACASYLKVVNPQNLGHFIESYVKRTDLGIVREISALKQKTVKNFKCPVMLVAGDFSPHLDDTVAMNGRLDPGNSTWMKFECGGMVHEEVPDKLCDAFRLFLQGMGYVPTQRAHSHHQVPSLSKQSLALQQSSISLLSKASLTTAAAAAAKAKQRAEPTSVRSRGDAALRPTAVC